MNRLSPMIAQPSVSGLAGTSKRHSRARASLRRRPVRGIANEASVCPHVTVAVAFSIVVLLSAGWHSVSPTARARAETTFTVDVDLGTDHGQSFGSLFEARNAAGQVVAGAGFQDVYNTRFRGDRHMVQFFVRPTAGSDPFTVERLPHPDLGTGVYLFDVDARLYAWSAAGGDQVRRWDNDAGRWLEELPAGATALRSGDGVMRLGKGRLVFANNAAKYNDRQILAPPPTGHYYNFYYALGHLCFYHHRPEAGAGSSTHILACPWDPDDSQVIDLGSACVLQTKYDRETPFAWGQWQDQILTVSNQGGIYVFENSRWRTALAADNTVSYQVYSILHWQDRLLLAQYPTGHVFAYQGREAQHIPDWPPCLPGVSRHARECQTLAIYRGDLLAGVWPWAEMWRYDRAGERWHSLGRMFTHPKITDQRTHPYEAEADRLGLVTNHWGQRVTGMVPLGDALFVSTSSKGTDIWKDAYDFLTEPQRAEYGAVVRLRMPGHLAAQIRWQERPSRFEFAWTAGRLVIRQDGEELATATVPADFKPDVAGLRVDWGKGVFGPLRGTILTSSSSAK